MVSSILNSIVICLFQLFSFMYIIKVLQKSDIKYYKYKNVILLVVGLVATFFFNMFFNNFLRPLMIFISYAFIFKNIFNTKLSTSIINCLITYIVVIIAELVELITIIMILKVPYDIVSTHLANKPLGSIIGFIFVVIITVIFKKMLLKIKNSIDKDFSVNFVWIIVIVLSAFLSLNINNIQLNFEFVLTTISCSLIVLIILFLFKEVISKKEIKSEYFKLFNYLENTESILTKYQKYNHENKNQLILIKGSLNNKQKAKELIDEILCDDIEHTDKWLDELKNIPSGGLKGLLSYKINYMMDKGINIYLSISPKLKNIKIDKIFNVKMYKEICQMIGVYLDNSYEASMETEKKSVSIEMFYQDNKINMIISNSFLNNIDLSEIDKAGYSTKGKGRGIGLALVKDIVDGNRDISIKREIINDYYFQYITINVNKDMNN